MKKILLLLIFLAFGLQSYAQLKYEKESRINKSEVPQSATKLVDNINFDSRVRWYKEMGLNAISFEAKTNYKDRSYSIEFSEDGIFEDMEIEISPGEIPSQIFQPISEYLTEKHNNYSIEKIQVQFLGSPDLILEFFQNINTPVGLDMNYEFVISTKIEGSFEMLEYLFSEDGEFLNKSQMTLSRTINIEY